MTLVKFYKKLLGSVGLTVDKKGKVLMGETPLLVNKLPLYVYMEGKNDNVILDHKGIPFNVLSENVLDGISKPLLKVIGVFEIQLNMMLKSMALVFLERLHTDYEYPSSVLFMMESLYKELEQATIRSKSKIDDLTLENFYKSIMQNTDLDIVKVIERHKVTYEGEEFASGVVVQYPVLNELKEALEENTKLGNSKMRKTDLRVYKAIFSFFAEELGNILGVSNVDGISDTTALMKAIIHVDEFIKKYWVLVEDSDTFFNEFSGELTVKDISIAQKLRKEAEFMPTVIVDEDKVQVVKTADVRTKSKERRTSKSDDSGEYVSAKELVSKLHNVSNRYRDDFVEDDVYDDEYYTPKRKKRRPVKRRRDEFIEDDDVDDFFRPSRRKRRISYVDDGVDDFFRPQRRRRDDYGFGESEFIDDDLPWY